MIPEIVLPGGLESVIVMETHPDFETPFLVASGPIEGPKFLAPCVDGLECMRVFVSRLVDAVPELPRADIRSHMADLGVAIKRSRIWSREARG